MGFNKKKKVFRNNYRLRRRTPLQVCVVMRTFTYGTEEVHTVCGTTHRFSVSVCKNSALNNSWISPSRTIQSASCTRDWGLRRGGEEHLHQTKDTYGQLRAGMGASTPASADVSQRIIKVPEPLQDRNISYLHRLKGGYRLSSDLVIFQRSIASSDRTLHFTLSNMILTEIYMKVYMFVFEDFFARVFKVEHLDPKFRDGGYNHDRPFE